MLKFLRSIVGRDVAAPPAGEATPGVLSANGGESFDLLAHLQRDGPYPRLDWTAVGDWVATLAPMEQSSAWGRAELAWLHRLRDRLGADYRVEREGDAVLLSSLEPRVARATLGFMARSQARIMRVLDGVASASGWGHDILIVFDDEEGYYAYVSQFYEGEGEFARSGGMYIDEGCGHFVTLKADLRVVEPTIVHELTHASLAHLPLPAWLNEGLAVNTERRLSPPLGPSSLTPAQMHSRHQAFWGVSEIQEFWSGKSWLRPDKGNELSYDLARILVEQLAADWPAFRGFALAADLGDAGQRAAAEHLGIDLGAAICALLGKDDTPASWRPDPGAWSSVPERGGFHG
jgi:hypothetical protein